MSDRPNRATVKASRLLCDLQDIELELLEEQRKSLTQRERLDYDSLGQAVRAFQEVLRLALEAHPTLGEVVHERLIVETGKE